MVIRYLDLLHGVGEVREDDLHDDNLRLSDSAIQVVARLAGSLSTISALVAEQEQAPVQARPHRSLTLDVLHDAQTSVDDAAVQSMLIHFGAATLRHDGAVEGGVALAVPNQAVREEFVNVLVKRLQADERQSLARYARVAVEDGEVANFVNAAMRSGVFAEVTRARSQAGGKVEVAFH